jgi:class 3 adenylate cyclase
MALGFGFVAYSAHVQFRREGSAIGLFNAISLEQTTRQIREGHGAALEALVTAMRRGEQTGVDQPLGAVASRLAERFDLTESQVEVLERAAEALLHERDQIQRLDTLAAVGREARVILSEEELLDRTLVLTEKAFARDLLRVSILREGRLVTPDQASSGADRGADRGADDPGIARALDSLEPVEISPDGDGATLILPLTVKDHPAGILEVTRPRGTFADRDRSVLESLASQLSIALENVRLYQQIDQLFRSYMSPSVATTLIADPEQAALGGAIEEVTVLFADLRGFTPFSERSAPGEVVALLNRYFAVAVPIVLENGGTVVQFVGDALMALFNAPTRQSDHSLRAARAALAIQQGIDEMALGQPDWPRFRIGVNTGTALVGNIGSPELRNFTAIGDTVNLAARLQTSAEVGHVVIGSATYEQIRSVATVHPLGPLHVKGKEAAVRAFVLLGLQE